MNFINIHHLIRNYFLNLLITCSIFIIGILFISCSDEQGILDPENNPQSNIIYVDCQNMEFEDGSQNAPFNSIQKAVDSSSFEDIIYVARGMYFENVTLDSSNSGTTVLGGFDATNWVRDVERNQTIINGKGIDSLFCIHLKQTNQVKISGFWVTNAQRLIMVSAASDILIERNYIFSSAGNNYTSGINVESSSDFTTENVTISNNVIWNVIGQGYRGGGIDVSIHNSNATNNIRIINNTIYDVSQDGILMGRINGLVYNSVVKNNIIIRARGTGIQFNNIAFGISDYNCVYDTPELYNGESTEFLGGLNDLNVNPLFIDIGAYNFHLQSDSPCIDAGNPISEYSNEPQPNGNRINIGAYGNTKQAAKSSTMHN